MADEILKQDNNLGVEDATEKHIKTTNEKLSKLIPEDKEVYPEELKNMLYSDFKKIIGIKGNLNEIPKDELIEKLQSAGFSIYLAQCFEDTGASETQYISDLKKEEIRPFGEIFEAIDCDFTNSQGTSNQFIIWNIIASYVACGLWFNNLHKFEDNVLKSVFEYSKETMKNSDKWAYIPVWELFKSFGNILPNSEKEREVTLERINTYFSPAYITNGLDSYKQFKYVMSIYNKVKEEIEELEAIPIEVKDDIKSIIGGLENLYKGIKNEAYVGLIWQNKEGVAKLSTVGGSKQHHALKTLFDIIYSTWSEFAMLSNDESKILPCNDIQNTAITDSYGYLPGWHKKNLSSFLKGEKKASIWDNGEEKKFEKACGNMLLKWRKESDSVFEYRKKADNFKKYILNCIVVKDLTSNTIQLKMTGIPYEERDNFKDKFLHNIEANLGSLMNYKLGTCNIDSMTNIATVAFIYDFKNFQNEMLFAYKLYDKPGKIVPKLSDITIGLGLDGNPVKYNLLSKESKITMITAGSRSGKGVMTMSLLSAIMGTGGSVIYIDCKPDLASMLWGLETKLLREKGRKVRFLALDTDKEISSFNGIGPTRYNGKNSMNVTADMQEYFNESFELQTLRILKLVQFLDLLVKEKELNVKNGNMENQSTVYFIIDELTKLSGAFAGLEAHIKEGNKVRALRNENEELYNYVVKVRNLYKGANTVIRTGLKASWGEVGVRPIFIGQELNRDWKPSEFVKTLIESVTTTIAGKVQITDNVYQLTTDEKEIVGQGRDANAGRGIFLKHNGKSFANKKSSDVGAAGINAAPAEKIDGRPIFRSYFCIVDNDFDYPSYKEAKDTDSLDDYWQKTETNYTTELLRYLGPDQFNIALNELYDFEKGENNDKVSYSGLLNLVLEKSQANPDEFYSNLNAGYDRLDNIFQKIKGYLAKNYNTLEEYLVDCSPESIYMQYELNAMLEGKPINKSTEPTIESDEDFSGFNDYTLEEDIENIEEQEQEQLYEIEKEVEEQLKEVEQIEDEEEKQAEIDRINKEKEDKELELRRKVEEQKKVREQQVKKEQSNKLNFNNVNTTPNVNKGNYDFQYAEPLIVNDNPFTKYNANGFNGNLLAEKEMSKLIMNDIEKVVGSLDKIELFRVNADGSLAINDMLYTPQIPEEVVESMPKLTQVSVRKGKIIELFNLSNIYKFRNLQILEIENNIIANGKAKRELCIRDYEVLFKKFRYLERVLAGDSEYSKEAVENGDYSSEETRTRLGLGGRIANLLGLGRESKREEYVPNPTTYSLSDKLWESRPVRVFTSALGWTVGIKAVALASTVFGPWGLLFGAFALAGAYGEQVDSKNQRGNTRVSKSSSPTVKSAKKTDKKKNSKDKE